MFPENKGEDTQREESDDRERGTVNRPSHPLLSVNGISELPEKIFNSKFLKDRCINSEKLCKAYRLFIR